MKLEDCGAVVAGGASGLGEATVRRLAAAGAYCVIMDLDEIKGRALAEELAGRSCFVPGDITRDEDIERAFDAGDARPIRLGVVTAFAGCALPVIDQNAVPHDLASFRRSIEVNVIGSFNFLRLAAARFARQSADEEGQRGVIVMTSSIAAYEGQPTQTAYAAGKASLIGMTLPAARDLAPFGIRVVTIAPGTFLTPVVSALPGAYLEGLRRDTLFPKRPGQPDEFGRLVVHIFENPYLNGETIRLDGGARLSVSRA